MNVQELLKAAKAAQNIPSNYRMARVLGVTDNTLNNWQSGRVIPTESTVVRLAEMAGIDAGQVLAEVAAMRADDGPVRAAWLAVAQRMRAAACLCLVALLSCLGTGNEASAKSTQDAANSGYLQQIKDSEASVNLYAFLLRVARMLARLVTRLHLHSYPWHLQRLTPTASPITGA